MIYFSVRYAISVCGLRYLFAVSYISVLYAISVHLTGEASSVFRSAGLATAMPLGPIPQPIRPLLPLPPGGTHFSQSQLQPGPVSI